MLRSTMRRVICRGLFIICISLAARGQNLPTSYGVNPSQSVHVGSATMNPGLAHAYSLLEQQKYEKASLEFAAFTSTNPRSVEAQLGLIRALFQAGKFSAAARAGENAVQLNPESVSIHAALADVYFRLGLLDAAESQYKTALALDGDSGRAWIGLGRIYSVRSMPEDAKHAFQRARDSNPRLFSGWLTGLSSPEQLATYRKYADKDEQQPAAPCELFSSGPENVASSQDPDKQEIPLLPIQDENGELRSVGVKARINGSGSALLVLDTGASGITIGRRLAEKAGVLKLADEKMQGMGGSGAQGYVAHIARLRLGSLELRNCMVHIVPNRQVLLQDGIIGTDTFRKYLITIDFPLGKLGLLERVNSGPGLEQKGWRTPIRAYEFGHFLLVPARLGQGAAGLFLLDSGANIDTVSESLTSKVGGMVSKPRFLEGSSGVVNSALGTDSAALEIGNIKLNQQPVVALDLSSVSKDVGTEIAGQIGLSFLKNFRIRIDYLTGTVFIER